MLIKRAASVRALLIVSDNVLDRTETDVMYQNTWKIDVFKS